MIATIGFSIIAGGLVLLAGRKDPARDPRLTLFLLILMALIPVMATFLPKIGVLPTAETSGSAPGFAWGKLLFIIWAVGFLLFIARLTIAATGLYRWRKRSVKIGETDGVEIREVDGLRGPVAAGVMRRVIFVPQTWSTWQEGDRKIVLAHELSHHRRRDPFWRLCAEIARAVHWYHPLAHWMANRFTLQCEYACDESVIREGTDAKFYARLLCGIAEKQEDSPLALAMANPSSLQQRISRMLQPSSRTGTLAFTILAALGATAACALSMVGNEVSPVSKEEVQLRLTADPFPGER
jgi:beta-lactamase regulating signal transducer with metallopeptidase domain